MGVEVSDDTITEAELAELKRLLAAASKAPWKSIGWMYNVGLDESNVVERNGVDTVAGFVYQQDADLATALRNAAPRLFASVARADQASAERETMRKLLAQSKRGHFHVEEDGWYSCPADAEYLGPDEHVCTCGADEWNAKVDAALAAPAPDVAAAPAGERGA